MPGNANSNSDSGRGSIKDPIVDIIQRRSRAPGIDESGGRQPVLAGVSPTPIPMDPSALGLRLASIAFREVEEVAMPRVPKARRIAQEDNAFRAAPMAFSQSGPEEATLNGSRVRLMACMAAELPTIKFKLNQLLSSIVNFFENLEREPVGLFLFESVFKESQDALDSIQDRLVGFLCILMSEQQLCPLSAYCGVLLCQVGVVRQELSRRAAILNALSGVDAPPPANPRL